MSIVIACSGGSRICEKGGPEIRCRARPEKVAQWGGGGGGGTPPTRPTSGVASKEKEEEEGKKKYIQKSPKKHNSAEKGGGGRGRFAPPLNPPLAWCTHVYTCVWVLCKNRVNFHYGTHRRHSLHDGPWSLLLEFISSAPDEIPIGE